MSNKGKVFTHEDLPRVTQQRIKDKRVGEDELARLNKWLADQTERNRVVAEAEDGTPIIAEEFEERALRHYATNGEGAIDSAVLSLVRGLAALTPEQRCAALNAFDMDGSLVSPFRAIEPEAKPKKAKK